MKVNIFVANKGHLKYVDTIIDLVEKSALERGTGIAKRSPQYIAQKIVEGKGVIALDGDKFVGFSYIESWGHNKFVANSGLIVEHSYREQGVAKRIKNRIFNLSRKLYPNSKIFSITTGLAVMRLNTELGFKPVTYSELTDDVEFWKGCQGCINYEILQRNNYKRCLCTALLYDPYAKKILKLSKLNGLLTLIR